MNSKERRELAISEIVLIVLAVIGISVVVWMAWARPLRGSTSVTVNSFATCKQASGSTMQESYPEVCVTKDGARFVNPDQKVELPSGGDTDDSSQNSTAIHKNLTISQWKVAFPYPDNVKSLSYSLQDAQTVRLNFDDIPGDCKGNTVLRRATQDQALDSDGDTAQQLRDRYGSDYVKQVGSYYYAFSTGATTCTDDQTIRQQIDAVSVGFTGSKIQNLVLAQ